MGQDIVKAQQRKNFYIDKKFQNNFILKFCSLVVGGALVTFALLYGLGNNSTTVSIIKSRVVVMTTADFILPVLTQTLIVVTIAVSAAVVIVLIFMTHKIAGPLFRFRQTLKALAAGDFSHEVRLRKDDQLLETVEEFNEMISAMRAQILNLKKELAAVKAAGQAVDDPKARQLNLAIEELEKTVNFFRT